MCSFTWKDTIRTKLKDRNSLERFPFEDIITAYQRLIEKSEFLSSQCAQLRGDNERLRQENIELSVKAQSGAGSANGHLLEQKLFKLQEELTGLHRQKGNTAEEMMRLNKACQEKDKELALKDNKIAELEDQLSVASDVVKRVHCEKQDILRTHELLKDECNANSMAYNALEESYRKVKMENEELLKRWMEHKGKMADKINEENEKLFKVHSEKLQKELADAAKEQVVLKVCGPDIPVCAVAMVPTKLSAKIEAHENDVNCVRWSPTGDVFASAGADRKVKVWMASGSNFVQRAVLTGSNAGVMAIDYDQEATLLVGASSDFATRIWTLCDHRLRHTLTGHASKVMAARFFGDSGRVITGSLDRTMKVWDLRSRSCVKTVFAGSAYHDLVACASPSSLIVSGHFDKTLRFWDIRSANPTNPTSEIALPDKITGLALSPDQCSLLVGSRDDSLRTLDMRMTRVVSTFQEERFRIGYDYTRPCYSPDGLYVACGGSDGHLCIWNTNTGRFEKRLKEPHASAIICCHWHPNGSQILACDRQKKVFLFAD